MLITMILLMQMYSQLKRGNQVIENYKKNSAHDIKALMDVSVKNKLGVTNMIYGMLITEEIEALLANINVEDEVGKTESRDLLYGMMIGGYKHVQKMGMSKVQFHLPNTESFLRCNCPDKYGDLLGDVRPSVNMVIKTEDMVWGYEEGRMSGGYRYIYPIHAEGKYVGSVEFSFELRTITRPVELTYDVYCLLLMDKDEIEEKTFDDYLSNYVLDPYINYGYINMDKNYKNLPQLLGVTVSSYQMLNEKLGKALETISEEEETFVYTKVKDQVIWAMNVPLVDVTGEIIGQVIYYKNDKTLLNLLNNRKIVRRNGYVLISVSFLLLTLSYMFFYKAKQKATFDSLTNLYTRHAFSEVNMDKIQSGVCLMIDIDDFKFVNDIYGHLEGDAVLRGIADIISQGIRKNDYAIRWGGEEFLVLLIDIGAEIGIERAESLRQVVADTDFDGIKVTISIGLSPLNSAYQSCIEMADKGLYRAKADGKNRIYFYDQEK